MMENVRIVLVNTSHPGNIGSSARAMKTMGLKNLYLVAPKLFPHDKATEMASGATDVLEQARVVETLAEAIADCHLVFGTSSRSRAISWPVISPRECATKIKEQAQKTNIAIVFGREQTGLTNEELHQCQYHIQIPADSIYCSLNLASAVQVLAYELRVIHESAPVPVLKDCDYASSEELEGFYEHLERVMIQIEFLNPKAPKQLMARLRRLFYRAELDKREVNILRGILGAIEKSCSSR